MNWRNDSPASTSAGEGGHAPDGIAKRPGTLEFLMTSVIFTAPERNSESPGIGFRFIPLAMSDFRMSVSTRSTFLRPVYAMFMARFMHVMVFPSSAMELVTASVLQTSLSRRSSILARSALNCSRKNGVSFGRPAPGTSALFLPVKSWRNIGNFMSYTPSDLQDRPDLLFVDPEKDGDRSEKEKKSSHDGSPDH